MGEGIEEVSLSKIHSWSTSTWIEPYHPEPLGKHTLKPQQDTTSHPPGWLKSKSQINTSISKDVGKSDLHTRLVGL